MKKIILLIAVLFTTSTFAIDNGTLVDKDLAIESILDVKTCTIKIKGTFDGKKIDINITIDADDCATAAGKILKAAME